MIAGGRFARGIVEAVADGLGIPVRQLVDLKKSSAADLAGLRDPALDRRDRRQRAWPVEGRAEGDAVTLSRLLDLAHRVDVSWSPSIVGTGVDDHEVAVLRAAAAMGTSVQRLEMLHRLLDDLAGAGCHLLVSRYVVFDYCNDDDRRLHRDEPDWEPEWHVSRRILALRLARAPVETWTVDRSGEYRGRGDHSDPQWLEEHWTEAAAADWRETLAWDPGRSAERIWEPTSAFHDVPVVLP